MNTTDNKYNGWTNYATWRINLEMMDGMDVSSFPQDEYGLSVALKDYVEEYLIESCPNGLAQDYALAFVSDVNWYEIAEHLIEEANND
jgi:hypothetical protein